MVCGLDYSIYYGCSCRLVNNFNVITQASVSHSMAMLLKVAIFVLLVMFIYCVKGFERVIAVNKSDVDDDGLVISHDEEILARCCIHGSCSCPSLYNALANLTSNVLINITTDVTLFSVIPLADLANITIAGHNNPTVSCNSSGGLHFVSCHNCIIEGITWKVCGTIFDDHGIPDINPVIQLRSSSNIMIKNCSFRDSAGQVIMLSAIMGNVTIDTCNFISNKQYNGNGTAIFNASPKMSNDTLLNFTITNCVFFYNEGAYSIIYLGQLIPKFASIYLQNLKFHNNKGIPIYLRSQELHINGDIEVFHSIAENKGGIFITDHSNVIFHKNSKVIFKNNRANNCGGAMIVQYNSTVTFEGNSAVSFNNNCAYCGGAVYVNSMSTVKFEENSTVTFNNNTSTKLHGGAMYISSNSTVKFEKNSTVTFNNNSAYHQGGAMYVYSNSTVTFKGNSTVSFNNNSAQIYSGGAMFAWKNSIVTFEGNSTVTFNNNTSIKSYGGAMLISINSTVKFEENSTVSFNNNSAQGSGGAMYVNGKNSTVTFEGNSTVTFNNNTSTKIQGGAMYIISNSTVKFEENSTITFDNNSAYNQGGAMYVYSNSIVTFKGNSTVSFNNNSAQDSGGAMYVWWENSIVTFEGNSTVTFNSNSAHFFGGAMDVSYQTAVTFEVNSNVTFNGNNAQRGGAVHTTDSVITFKGNSIVLFTGNSANALDGGAMMIESSSIKFIEHSTTMFSSNRANYIGGAISIYNSNATIEGSLSLTFNGNNANSQGGAVYILYNCDVTFTSSSLIIFFNNTSTEGGALAIYEYSNITFKGYSAINFDHNIADANGGAMVINNNCSATFKGNSTATFYGNRASYDGGSCFIENHSSITFSETAKLKVFNNSASTGGALITKDTCFVMFEGNSKATFYNNTADIGGALMISDTSIVIFEGNSKTTLNMNKANQFGGALCIDHYSSITIDGNSTVECFDNIAISNGGVVYINQHSTFKSKGNTKVKFRNDGAGLGGSIFIESSNVTIEENSFVEFINNTALQSGGAIYLSDHSHLAFLNATDVTFSYNSANDYGGTIYILLKNSSIVINSFNVYFSNNTAEKTQSSIYMKLPDSCNNDCLDHSVNGNLNKDIFSTSPYKLVLNNKVKCIDDNYTYCAKYYMNNIMLGQEITFDACVLDYFDKPTEATDFVVSGMDHQNYNISGSKYISVTCNHTVQGISITGNLHSNHSYNYSTNISLYTDYFSDTKMVFATLIVELTQCHPGFQYFNKSRKCECYDAGNIVLCSGSSSTIKKGYWFGNVIGKPTTTYCPDNYCNFTCCETTNDFYHLSPVRVNQCRSHRSGTACGNCEEGYTLSFDTPDCVEINKCTIGQTILVTVLSLLYWIIVVIVVFVMTYFKLTVGSLYAIIYYYSIVDILLSQTFITSNELYTTIYIMSSLAKLTPQFLGQLCLVRNMSGIDQQFIHYVHPIMISLILIMISILARRSQRVSSFVSRGVIHFICFLLLLSYTSVATTSLLLMRPLTFVNVDEVYTYLSPDIKYFHGRHLAYIVLAIIFTLAIVIGFPLLLLLEPFLNSKINFVKIKPLLDQFQGCYKDKYRCFAGYYMICRLVIILLIIVKIFDDVIIQYILVSFCALMQLIHVLVRPYVSAINNIFDAIILQLIVIISVLSVVEFTENYDILIIAYLLVILPLPSLVTLRFWINRKSIQSEFELLKQKYIYKYNSIPTDDADESTEDQVDIIVDNSTRRNVTIVDV